MCGICGVIGIDNSDITKRMLNSIVHRGPDENGFYRDDNLQISMGIRRLSIIDLETGSQPLFNEDGTIVLIINGEIYNYLDLRKELEKKEHIFNTNSDGEVLIHLYEEKGIEGLELIRGMYAFCLLDRSKGSVYLARDRLGMKPLYYSIMNDVILFASEIKALLASGKVKRGINPDAIDLFLSFPAIPAPLTMIEGIEALMPANYLEIRGGSSRVVEYWNLSDRLPSSNTFLQFNLEEQAEKLRDLLGNIVREHMVSDVPLGSFLSGGIDSSIISYFASKFSTQKLNTFSIGFDLGKSDKAGFDELSQAHFAAELLGTNHHERIISPKEILDDLTHIIYSMDQPTGDGINSYYISKVAKEKVKVSLSGTGGDELFGGYRWFSDIINNHNLFRRWERIPSLFRKPIEICLSSFHSKRKIFESLSNERGSAFEKAYRNNRWLMLSNFKRVLYNHDFHNPSIKREVFDPIGYHAKKCRERDLFSMITYLQLKYDMADLLLRDCDVMSMSHSIEVRLPFLDHRLVEFSLTIPPEHKIKDGLYKAILRKSMDGLLPSQITSRSKQGFIFPLNIWLKGELRCLIDDALSLESVNKRGFFDPKIVKSLCDKFFSGEIPYFIPWNLTVLELWCRNYIDRNVFDPK